MMCEIPQLFLTSPPVSILSLSTLLLFRRQSPKSALFKTPPSSVPRILMVTVRRKTVFSGLRLMTTLMGLYFAILLFSALQLGSLPGLWPRPSTFGDFPSMLSFLPVASFSPPSGHRPRVPSSSGSFRSYSCMGRALSFLPFERRNSHTCDICPDLPHLGYLFKTRNAPRFRIPSSPRPPFS